MCLQLKYAQNSETRQQAYESYEAHSELNAPLLDHILALRHSLATRMGHKSWADYRTEWRRIKSRDKVEKVCSIYYNIRMVLINTYSF
jgi:Zn-dependent oligopeptidase